MKKKNLINNKNEWIVGAIAVLAAVFFIMYFFFSNYGKFDYNGLEFREEKVGKIPVYRYSYYFNESGQTYKYNLYLRQDPRKNDVPVTGEIEFARAKITYISINSTGLTGCEDSSIAISSLSSFLINNLISVKGATPDQSEAEMNNQRYATCEIYPDNPVVLIQSGEETEIVRKNQNCYIITASQCEILDAIEKFEVQAILDAKSRD